MLHLPAELTIYAVAELRTAWLEALAAAEDDLLVADASAVMEVDAAGLQLVLALAQALERDGRALRVDHASTAFAAACRTLGLAALLAEETAA